MNAKPPAPASLGSLLLVGAAHVISIGLGLGLVFALLGSDAGEFARFYANGGTAMRQIVQAAALQASFAMIASIFHLARRPLPFAVHFVLPLAIFGLGLQGAAWGYADLARVAADIPPVYAPTALARGMSIAEIPAVFGAILAASALLPTLTLAALSIHRWQASGDDRLAGSALSAALVGGASVLLAGLAFVRGKARLAAIEAFAAFADDAPIELALERHDQALGLIWIALALGVLVWAATLRRAWPAREAGSKIEGLISAVVVLVGVLGLVGLQQQSRQMLREIGGDGLGFPEQLAALLGDDEAAAAVARAQPLPEGPLLRNWSGMAHEVGATALLIAPDGGVFIAGRAAHPLDLEVFVERLDPRGEQVWRDTWSVDYSARHIELAPIGDTHVVVRAGQDWGGEEVRVYSVDGEQDRRRPWVIPSNKDADEHGQTSFALGLDERVYLLRTNLEAEQAAMDALLTGVEPDPEHTPPKFTLLSRGLDSGPVRELGLDRSGRELAVSASGDIYLGHSDMVTSEGERALKDLPADAVPFSIEPSLHAYGPEGELRWELTWGNGSCRVDDMIIDAEGNIHVVGSVNGPIEADAPTDAPADIYIASVSSAGELTGLQQFGSPGHDHAIQIGRVADTLWVAGTAEDAIIGRATVAEPSAFLALRSLAGEAGPMFTWTAAESANVRAAAVGDEVAYLIGDAHGDFEYIEDWDGEGWTFLAVWRR